MDPAELELACYEFYEYNAKLDDWHWQRRKCSSCCQYHRRSRLGTRRVCLCWSRGCAAAGGDGDASFLNLDALRPYGQSASASRLITSSRSLIMSRRFQAVHQCKSLAFFGQSMYHSIVSTFSLRYSSIIAYSFFSWLQHCCNSGLSLFLELLG